MNTITEEIGVMDHDMEYMTISKQRKKKDPIHLQECFKNVYSIIDYAKPTLKKLQMEGKDVHKSLFHEIKLLEKASANHIQKKAKHASNRVTGFTKPLDLLPPVAAFLGCSEKLSRAQVTHLVNTYIETHKLKIADKRQTFFLDENLAIYFGGQVNTVDSYSLFTRRIKFAFPIDPKVTVIASLANLGDVGATDCDAVIVLSYNAEFLTKVSDGSLFEKQIFINRGLSEFADAAVKFAIPKRVLFYAINDSDTEPSIFIQTRNSPPTTVELAQFSAAWLSQKLGGYIATAN